MPTFFARRRFSRRYGSRYTGFYSRNRMFSRKYRRNYSSRNYPSRSYSSTRFVGAQRSLYARTAAPELKVFEKSYNPFPVSYGDMLGNIVWQADKTGWFAVSYTGNEDAVISPPLNNMAQDTSSTGRLGQRVTMKYISIHVQWHLPVEFAAPVKVAPCTVRTILVCDKQSNGAIYGTGPFANNIGLQPVAPQISTVLQKVVSGRNTGGTADVMYSTVGSMLALDNRDRFTILFDRRDYLSDNGKGEITIDKMIRLNNMKVTFNGLADGINTNALFMIFLSDNEKVDVNNDFRPICKFYTRVRYIDN